MNYTRDLAGNITSVSQADPQGTFEQLADQITYKPFGPMTGLTYGNGLTLTRSFNQSYQMTGYQVPNVLHRTINYTPDGNIWGIQDHLQTTDTSVFEYDPVDQLIGADGGYGTRLFDYDANGNRTWIDRDGAFDEYEVAYYSNRLMETLGGQIQYTYDANGNPVARGTDSFSYDSHNRLKSATVAGQSASYGYNVAHQRVSKTVGSDTTLYFYGPGGELLAEVVASSGLTSAEYAWLNGEPLALFRNDSTYFVHNDHLATPQRLTDSAGGVSWSADYEPFGKAQTTGIEFNLRFPGQYFDAESGLHYNWHRYYDPETGRYITSDPIGLRAGLNTYSYANGNPLTFSDPDGRWAQLIIFAWGGIELGLSAWDAYDVFNTVTDDCSTTAEKWTAGGLFAAGVFLPGNYGWADNAVKGGRYREVRRANIGGEVHHMPANSVTDLPHADGPSIFMSKTDHRKTASWGSSREARAYREKQKDLVRKGRMDDAIEMDIDDIRKKFGDKYDDAILEMIDKL